MGPERISARMTHYGILVGKLDDSLRFYQDVLGFRETWRGGRDEKQLSWVNLQLPDGDDYIELMLYAELPAPDKRGTPHHVCLEVPDMDKALAALEARKEKAGYTRPMEIRTGINRRRQLNLYDPDGTRVELMEPRTVDGKPVPSSTAPPPR
jgi:lactoylglutathione lyase